ncbi:hypothetical protein D3C75_991480 [compost metagenome]
MVSVSYLYCRGIILSLVFRIFYRWLQRDTLGVVDDFITISNSTRSRHVRFDMGNPASGFQPGRRIGQDDSIEERKNQLLRPSNRPGYRSRRLEVRKWTRQRSVKPNPVLRLGSVPCCRVSDLQEI